jgi:hypothetical protein
MFAVHPLEHRVGSGLEREVEIVAERGNLEVRVQDIRGHVVRIARSEADTVESRDFPEFVEQFPERRDDIGLVPSKRGFIPELFPR